MLALVLTAALLQDPEPPESTAVAAAIEALRDAFANGDAPARVRAIEAASTIPHVDVVAWIAKGLRDPAPTVASAAIEGLRFMPHPEALDALHRLYARDKRLREDEDLFARLLKAIGQHGSARSIAVLADQPFASPYDKVLQARVLGLGHIRDARSLEALIGVMRKAGRARVQNHMHSFRLALMVLTAADEGMSQDAWMRWWNDHKGRPLVAPEPPRLPRQMQLQWDAYWGNPTLRERAPERGERGNDPQGGG